MQPKNTLTSVFKQKKRMFAQYAFPQKNGKRLETYKSEGKTCVINNVFRTKQSEFTLTNISTVKEKTLVFEKSEQQNYSFIEMVINEYEPMNIVNVIVKIVEAEKLQVSSRGLSLNYKSVVAVSH